MKKIVESHDKRNLESVRSLFVIFTRVTTLHSYYIMHSFSGNQKRVIFSCTLLTEKCPAAKSENYQANLGRKKVKPFLFYLKKNVLYFFQCQLMSKLSSWLPQMPTDLAF